MKFRNLYFFVTIHRLPIVVLFPNFLCVSYTLDNNQIHICIQSSYIPTTFGDVLGPFCVVQTENCLIFHRFLGFYPQFPCYRQIFLTSYSTHTSYSSFQCVCRYLALLFGTYPVQNRGSKIKVPEFHAKMKKSLCFGYIKCRNVIT